jgi:hypothetical protein
MLNSWRDKWIPAATVSARSSMRQRPLIFEHHVPANSSFDHFRQLRGGISLFPPWP